MFEAVRRFLNVIRGILASGTGWLLLAVLAAPLVARVALIADTTAGPHGQDLRGVLSDLAIATAAVAVALLLARVARVLALAWVALLCLVQFANYENVIELKSLASALDLKFFASSTFVLGSALSMSRPVLLGVTLLGSLLLAWRGLASSSVRDAAYLGVSAAVLLGLQVAWPTLDRVAYWRQVNVVQYNATFLAQTSLAGADPGPRFGDPPTAMLDLLPEIGADLDGTPVGDTSARAKNVILVAIESVSGAFVQPVAAAQGYGPGELFEMEHLSQLAREHRSFATFVAQNRKTSRGMYSLLCGEFPNFGPGTPKMTEHATGGWRRCLPQVLRDAGYQTLYLQGAPLPFMMKDRFMPRAGFDRVHGHEFFDKAYARSHWGVDDRALFERALEVIREVRKSDQPHFVTLLTVGTHHPFVVPANFMRRETGIKRKALHYADLAVDQLMAGLEEMGALEDTLVLLTSDESRGMETPHALRKLDVLPLTDRLSQNWGYMVALDPATPSPSVELEPYAMSDMALSVVDYLDLGDRGQHFFGRSLFRRYSEPRRLFFANTNVLRASYIDRDGSLVWCSISDGSCARYVGELGVFGDARLPAPVQPGDDDVLELARRSVYRSNLHPERRDYRLVGEDKVQLHEQAAYARHFVHGGQHIDLPRDQWIEVEVDVEARGSVGAVELSHYIRNGSSWQLNRQARSRTHVRRNARLYNGDRFVLRYTLASDDGLQGIKCQSYAKPTRPGKWDLVFHKARMSVRWGRGRPEPGAHIVQSEIIKAGGKQIVAVGHTPGREVN